MIDLETLRDWANVKGQTADDALLVALEARVVAFVERTTGRYFGASGEDSETTEVLSGGNGPILWLTDEPVIGDPTPAFTVETRSNLSSAWSEVDSTSYEVDGRKLVLLSEDGWASGTRNVRATYQRGYAAGEEPGEIRQLVMSLVAAMYKGGRKDPADLPESYLDQVPGAAETIARWRKVPV